MTKRKLVTDLYTERDALIALKEAADYLSTAPATAYDFVSFRPCTSLSDTGDYLGWGSFFLSRGKVSLEALAALAFPDYPRTAGVAPEERRKAYPWLPDDAPCTAEDYFWHLMDQHNEPRWTVNPIAGARALRAITLERLARLEGD